MIIGTDGKIASVGLNLAAPQGATLIQANLAWLTPGLFDLHSHAGVYSFPGDAVATQDGTPKNDVFLESHFDFSFGELSIPL